MKHAALFLLLLLCCIQGVAQQEIFYIDSLPKAGLKLDQGWKWHLGDKPEWAKPDFDDSAWESIDPTLDIFDLPQIPKTGEIGWLRLHLKKSDPATQELLFTLRQSCASECFLNGQKFFAYGKLHTDRSKILALNPVFKANPFPSLPNDSTSVLAIRFALQPGIRYTRLGANNSNSLFSIIIYSTRNYIEQYDFINLNNVKHSNIFRIGAFLLLLIAYLAMFSYYPKQKANLFFAFYAICDIFFNLSQNYNLFGESVGMYYWVSNFNEALQWVSFLFLLTGLYHLLEQKSSWYYWFCIALVFIGIGINFYFYSRGIFFIIFGNLVNFEIVRLSYNAIKTKKPGAWVISFGGINFLVFWVAFYISVFIFPNIGYHTIAGSIYIYADVFYNLAILSIPVAVSIYSGLEIALTNRSLKEKLTEVEQLSLEKQQILAEQNQTLERQVSERTAELVHKNRELEIEAALEKVRSRSLAMQKSHEVLNVAATLYEELQKLGFTFGIIGINLIDAETRNMESWVAGFGHENYPQSYNIPYFEHPFQKSFIEAWQNGIPYLVYQLTGAEKKSYDDFMFTQSGYKDIPDEVKKRMIATESVTFSLAFMKHGALLWASTLLTEEKAQIFQRFAKVFEQAYTRFLDLQLKEQQSARLAEEKQKLEQTLTELRSTQAQLIQSEKLASLGELTAGIAHEIQNPLNFVNNFSEINRELITEMKEEIEKGNYTEAKAIAEDLETNEERINHHGQRASSIVKGMLEHSRASTGVKEPTDINTLADEYLRLAYHGLRAKDNNFNATMETHFEPDLPLVSVIPQDIGRVLLNLINNAFYAVQQRSVADATNVETRHALSLQQPPYQPTVTITTQKTVDQVIIKIQDNGNGIPESIQEKIFQPFFTTKPTGQGTGLGLSLAYDIVTKGHGGALEVSSTMGFGSALIIRLPS